MGYNKWDADTGKSSIAAADSRTRVLATKIQSFIEQTNKMFPGIKSGHSAIKIDGEKQFAQGPDGGSVTFNKFWQSEWRQIGGRETKNQGTRRGIIDMQQGEGYFKKSAGMWAIHNAASFFKFSSIHATALLGPKNGWSHTRFSYSQTPLTDIFRADSFGAPGGPTDLTQRVKWQKGRIEFLKDQISYNP